MRRFTELITDLAKCNLDILADKTSSPESYRRAMAALGGELSKAVNRECGTLDRKVMLACASEDADWLAKGLMEGLDDCHLKIAVYWNDRVQVGQDAQGRKIEISPIVKSYEEPCEDCDTLIVVKSIISTSCVVKTQLTRLIGRVNPSRILIAAPVMFKDSEESLRREFPESISALFHFLTLAIDDEKDGDAIVPGIGGMIYPRIGLGEFGEKNRYMPELVVERLKF